MGEAQIGAIVEEVAIGASPAAVWAAIVDDASRRAWWSYLDLDPVVGGRFLERWTDEGGTAIETAGTVTEMEPERLLRLTWADTGWPAQTEVEISLTAEPAGTLVRVSHSKFDLLPNGEQLAIEHAEGWRMHLADLRAAVERG